MIKSKRIVLAFLSLAISYSCSSQEGRTRNPTTIAVTEKMKIEIKFYPSSGGKAIYTIDYSEGVIEIKNLDLIGDSEKEYRKFLNDDEIKKVEHAISGVKKREELEDEIILDSWRIELKINGVIYYNKSNVNLKTLPPDVENILKLLIEDSTIKIDLFGFS
jgi:hypothetical protein